MIISDVIRTISYYVLWWKVMPSYRSISRQAALAAAACAALLVVAAPSASPAPAFDSQGYVDSTARCTTPDTAVIFGSTAGSRVAICSNSDGDYEYRGVRVRDGAKLITSASRSSDGAFTATSDGIEYMVTSSALVISAGERVIRDEPMVDFHQPGTATSSTSPADPTTSTTPTTPLPPPLPAEEGGS